MDKSLINSATKEFVNWINLPDDWTGDPGNGAPGDDDYVVAEWQVPDGHELVDLPGGKGRVWNGTSFDPRPPRTEFKVSFDDFEERFTSQEWNDATNYIYATDTGTGLLKRGVLVQGLARAQARNSVNLLHAKVNTLLDLLVTGGVITEERKTEILTP